MQDPSKQIWIKEKTDTKTSTTNRTVVVKQSGIRIFLAT